MKRMRFDLRTGLIWAAVLVGTIWATNVCAQEAAPGEAAPAVPEVVLAEAVRTPEEAASAARDSAANLAEELAMRLETDRENAPLWLELGHAYLLAGEPKRAEKAFKQAQKKADGNKQTMAQAFNGLGLAYTARGRRLQSAVEFFKKALRRDPSYIEAHYNLARAYYKHNWLTHAIRAARDAVAVDSTYTPALQLIELCRAVRTGDKQVSKASYEKFLEKDPDNHATWLEWGKVALAEGEYGDILKRLVPMVRRHRDWLELYPLVAQAYWKVNLPEKGWIVFNDYIDGLDEEGKALYRDFRLVTTKETANAYGKASSEDQKKMAARFWAERDPDYTTEVNERQLEHFRRVWFARTYFSKNANPWDRRGEVYIRYGEPDHRSRSINPTPPPTHSVSAVKERYYDMIYSDQHIILAMGGGTEFRTGQDTSTEEDPSAMEENQGTMLRIENFDSVVGGEMGALVGPVFPIRSYTEKSQYGIYLPVGSTDMSVVKWESWVYTKVNGGIVIDFTHELGRKGFDYAPIPELGKTPGLRHGSRVGMDDIRAMTALTQRSPMVIARTAFAGTPEQYEIAPEDRPFDFHFDQAQFRGQEDGSSRLEVYWGVPMASATFFEKDERTGIRAVCRVALADKESGKLMRSETELIYVEDGDRTEGSGFIPHLALLDVPPGEYTMDVRMQDQVDGEVGSYRKNLEVKAFPGGELRLSDIQMAWKVREGGLPDKFTKSGLNVLPMPTRIYKHGEPVFVYYEVYNLSRDDFGMTNYTVEYTIRSGKPPGAIQRIFRAFKGGREEEVSVAAQEQLGVKETETSYVELDLSAAMAGEVVLTVTVKDLVSGEEVSRESKFELAE